MGAKNNKRKTIDEALNFSSLNDDFIPFATHISKRTILTKNLQVLQTIKINNFLNKELHHIHKHTTLRELIRSAIQKNIKNTDFAFWIHTLRRKVNLEEILMPDEEYSADLNTKWNKFNRFEKQYINELYITILAKGPEIKGKDVMLKYFTNARLENFVNEEVEKIELRLTQVVDGILEDISSYKPICLQIRERYGKFYSENIEFFHKILNLIDTSAEVDEVDISSVLAISEVAVLQNKINLKNKFAEKSIAILTLKHYLETSPEILDKILVLPFEFIIYQAFDFINVSEVLDKYYNQYKMLKASKDFKLMKQLGLSDAEFENIEQKKGEVTLEYGESQISIIVIADSEKSLDEEASALIDVLYATGFVFIREDVTMEDSFLASLPGNFFFLRRMQPMQTSKIAGFASIDNHPIGRLIENTWGDAVCLMRSNEGYPYFFNFHDESSGGHTIFFGKEFDIQQNAIANFLIMQSRKFDVRVLCLDFAQNTKLFNIFLGGKYCELSLEKNKNTLNLNPFKLPLNSLAFEKFLRYNLQISGNENENTIKYLEEKILPFVRLNNFQTLDEFLNAIPNQNVIKTFFSKIKLDGLFNHIFNGMEDDILSFKSSNILSIHLGEVFEEIELSKFFFPYLIFTIIELTKDKKRTILKIDSFLEVCLKSGFTKAEIANILMEFKQNNVVLLALENYHFFEEYETTKQDGEILELISTQIYTPAFINYGFKEADITNYYLKNIIPFAKLTQHEKEVIFQHSFEEKIFVVKHADKIIALEFNPKFSPLYYFFLASRGIEDSYLLKLKSAIGFEEKLAEAKVLHAQLFKK